ncbi:MAG: PIN domain-containing protein [Candidatus Omnitrophica bacterium]|nr:PIN domain-containing protein [Candidatus Omnitrophota bacterium]
MKIAFDTNVIVRMIALDDEVRLKKAIGLIQKHQPKDIFICYGVFIEAYYVLTKQYDMPKDKVLDAFEDLLRVEQFSVDQETALRLAISKAKKGGAFNDALIGEVGAVKNVRTDTFDKALKNNNSFEVLS